jgi:hypothetical protein
MNRKIVLLGLISTVLAFGLSLSGCAMNKATTKATNFEKKPIELASGRTYEILGPISIEKKWFGILGFSYNGLETNYFTVPANDVYLYQDGGVTYKDLFTEAKRLYPETDAVVDINVDYLGSVYAVFYAQRQNIVSGIAIKYTKEAQ